MELGDPSSNVDDNIVQTISNILIPKRAVARDTPCWTLSSNGNFSVRSAYAGVIEVPQPTSSWKWIWKLLTPAKLNSF